MKFEILGKPFGKQRPKVTVKGGFGRAYTPEPTVNYETQVKYMFQLSKPNTYDLFDKPLQLHITAFFDIPQSFSKKNKVLAITNQIFPTKKPDFDNIAKVISDALNGLAYKDDTQIVYATVKKIYAPIPKVEVEILEYSEEIGG